MIKLSKREKSLLLILGCMLILGGLYYYVYVPKFNKVKALRDEVKMYKEKIEEVKKEASFDSTLNKDLKNLDKSIATMTLRLLPTIKQEKIILILNDMLNISNLKAISMQFSEIEIGNIEDEQKEEKKEVAKGTDYLLKQLMDQYKKLLRIPTEKEEEKKKEEKKENPIQVEKMSITIGFEGSYADLMSFLKEIETYDKKIVVKNISIHKEETLDLKGSFVLELYSVPKFHEQDEEYLRWDYDGKYGKYNPFMP